jgi:hypothetical protein
MQDHHCLVIKPRSSDYIKGVNSPIVFKAVSDGNWTPRIEFFENQDLAPWGDTNGCVLFAAQESFDAQMDNLIATGQMPPAILAQFNSMGYMDLGRDGLPHFHSSPRFLQVLTGNGTNGNSCPEAWDVMRKYGVLPWRDLPYDATITETEYFAPISQTSLEKAAQFLTLIGGKDSIQYHWILNDSVANNIPAMQESMPQAPLCLGTPVCEPWNQEQPPTCTSTDPAHSTIAYSIDTLVHILDHYSPYEKELAFDYPIPYALQGIVTLPPTPTQVETQIVQDSSIAVEDIAQSPAPASVKESLLAEIAQLLEKYL